MSDSSDSEVAETQQEVEVRRGAVRARYRNLLDTIAREEDDLVNIEAGAGQLTDLMRDNKNLYTQVEAPQEAVMDAMVIRHLSRLCRQQAEQLSANINQFRQEEYVERLKAAMKVVPGSNLSRRKWVLLGRRASVLFKKSPYLSSMLGSLDIAPPLPKNTFYVSFLINEKRASVSMSASGLPELRPVSSKESGNASGGKNQVVANVTMEDWRKLVGKLGIRQPSIAHL